MSIVKPINEIVRERMNECADAGAQQFIKSIRAIYCSTEQGTPDHIGTCILVQVKQTKYLLTAAHVIDNNEYSSLYIGGETGLVLIEGNFVCTEKTDSGRENDYYDFAWLALSEELINRIGDVDFVSDDRFSSYSGATEGRLYLALGYPNSKNKKVNHQNRSVKPHYLKYSSTVKPNSALCQKLGISGEQHYFLDYNSKHSKNSEGLIVNSVGPRGISGGALIDMGNISKPEQYILGMPCSGRLAGMLIENHKEHKAMLAVKLDFIIEKIEKHDAL
jgi:hypothetical protein